MFNSASTPFNAGMTPAIGLQPVSIPTVAQTMTPFGPANVVTQQTGLMPTMTAIPNYAAQAAAAQQAQEAQKQQIAEQAFAQETGRIAAQQQAEEQQQLAKQLAMQQAQQQQEAQKAAEAGKQAAREKASRAAQAQAPARKSSGAGGGENQMAQAMQQIAKLAPQLKNMLGA